MDYEIVERQLSNWADWHRNSSTNLGYPKRAMVAVGGGQSVEGVFQEICDAIDAHSAEVMEALVIGLPIDQRSAVYCRWLGCVNRGGNQETLLDAVYVSLAAGIVKRGLC